MLLGLVFDLRTKSEHPTERGGINPWPTSQMAVLSCPGKQVSQEVSQIIVYRFVARDCSDRLIIIVYLEPPRSFDLHVAICRIQPSHFGVQNLGSTWRAANPQNPRGTIPVQSHPCPVAPPEVFPRPPRSFRCDQ